MPVGDDRLLELLSGYLDDALDEREQVDVESALADPAAQQLLEVLRQNRASVARIAKSSSGLSDDFTSRVMAAIEASPVAEPVQLPDADSNHPAKRSRTTRWLMGIAAVAAAALCIVMVTPPAGDPVDQVAVEITTPDIDPALAVSGQPDIQDRIVEPADVEPADVQYVSDLEWRMSMALVLHVAPTPQAQEDGLLQSLLSDAGIRSAAPIVADEQLQSTLLDSEMIVTDESISQSALYYVRAKATAVDAALQKVWGDRTNFPSAYFNLSIDGPESRLMEQIAHSTGKRFTADQAFAAPVSRLDNGKPRVRLPAFKSQEVLVAKQGRSGMLMSGSALGGGNEEMADLLILVKLP